MRRNTATPHWVDVPPDAGYLRSRRAAVERPSRPEPDPIPDRYAAVGIGEDEVAIYDRESPDAWIQSTRTVPLATPEAGNATDR